MSSIASSQSSSTSSSRSNFSSPCLTPRRMRSFSDSCKFCIVEPEKFEDAIKEKLRRNLYKKKNYVIERNDIWSGFLKQNSTGMAPSKQ